MDNLSQLSTETLYTYMCNSLATGAGCTGHTKAHYNQWRANQYRNELNKRGEKLPKFDLSKLFPKEDDADWRSSQRKLGIYNGPGSF